MLLLRLCFYYCSILVILLAHSSAGEAQQEIFVGTGLASANVWQTGEAPIPSPMSVDFVADKVARLQVMMKVLTGMDSWSEEASKKFYSIVELDPSWTGNFGPKSCPDAFNTCAPDLSICVASFCAGTASTISIGHEWAHAYLFTLQGLYTTSTNGEYRAVCEGYADIIGLVLGMITTPPESLPSKRAEDVCYFNYTNSYSGTVDWLTAKETGAALSNRWTVSFGEAIGIWRDAWTPTCFGAPTQYEDANYYTGNDLNTFAHVNLAILSHSFAALVDGSSVVGNAGIGIDKAAALYGKAMLTQSTSFEDVFEVLKISCDDLVGEPLVDIRDGSTTLVETISANDCCSLLQVVNYAMAKAAVVDCTSVGDSDEDDSTDDILDPNSSGTSSRQLFGTYWLLPALHVDGGVILILTLLVVSGIM